MITITNETIGGNVSYTNGEYRMTGDYRIGPSTKKIETLNVSVTKSEVYSGNVNAYKNGDELQYNYNNMKQEEVSDIANEITSLVGEIEAKYSNISLSTL